MDGMADRIAKVLQRSCDIPIPRKANPAARNPKTHKPHKISARIREAFSPSNVSKSQDFGCQDSELNNPRADKTPWM